jgi:gluconate 2-dehydrogenase gamma chain
VGNEASTTVKNDDKTKGPSRRKFLGAGVLFGLVPLLLGRSEGIAQTYEPPQFAALVFFNPYQAVVIEAAVARIVPGDANDPGAREAGVVHYIDMALAGVYADCQTVYRRGINGIDNCAKKKFGRRFIDLSEIEQDAILKEMEQDKAVGFSYPSASVFFALLRQHTIEGMFSDPVYGGNRNAVGWKLLGFPGVQYGYTAEEMQADADLSKKRVLTLKDFD